MKHEIPEEMPKRIALRVTGLVQGVGFRWWCRQEATRLGLAGRVRNRSDGSVEIEAEGTAAAVAELRRRMEDGPAAARVRTVEARDPGPEELPRPFRIER